MFGNFLILIIAFCCCILNFRIAFAHFDEFWSALVLIDRFFAFEFEFRLLFVFDRGVSEFGLHGDLIVECFELFDSIGFVFSSFDGVVVFVAQGIGASRVLHSQFLRFEFFDLRSDRLAILRE